MSAYSQRDDPWSMRAHAPALVDGAAHVWRVNLDASENELRDARILLAADECARADRFKFDWLRRRYTVGRAALRRVLGSYLDVEPQDLLFSYGAHGKPGLARPVADLAFNVSDSEDLALIAVGKSSALGVDIEHMEPERACRDIAHRFFADSEVAALEGLPPDQYVEGFYRCWTRKEAFIKALGGGLSVSLKSFAVSVGDDARLLQVDDPALDARQWTFTSVGPATDFVGCVAALGLDTVTLLQWTASSFET